MRETVKKTRQRMDKAVEVLRDELRSLRTGRASLAILDPVRVDYYGTPTPLNQVANLGVPDANLLIIQPWDPTLIPAIEHAIQKANLGLNPMNDGKVIKLPVPAPTQERRKELVKVAHEYAERARTAVRNVRREANDELKAMEKGKKISEDDLRRGLDEVQELTDEHVEEINKVVAAREREILEV
ncbi:MAG TPA: ribosome recycling factor [Thermoanaerobaculaceae bacterium]|nr:ribosome recycling factor [Thermoanaerobaculaceae bacterium]HRS16566.1 ribosome recycling factor [Thermoanaerobaculaceae bacterium]